MSPGNAGDKTTSGPEGGSQAGLLQESLTCGVLVVDEHDGMVACTPEATQLLHLKSDHRPNPPLDSLPAPLPKLIRDAAAGGKSVLNRQLVLENGSGGAFLRVSVLPMPARKETIVVLSHLATTPILEQNMRRLDRLASLGTLSAGMAHEIKNGMVAIRTFIELLLQKGEDTGLTDVVARELQRIDMIVSQTLRYASPNRASLTSVRVHDVLDHSLRLVEDQINSKLILLSRHYKADPDTVQGDEYQLQQGFMNLLFNAIEAMGPEGTLTVSTENVGTKPEDQHVRIQIQDTGPGIPPENLTRLFEPFFTTKKNGTGLGLAICQRIIHEQHGTISAQSEVNKGSTFSILLPALAAT